MKNAQIVNNLLYIFCRSCSQIKKMICLILMKETSTSKEIHVELTECVLQIINDQKILATNLHDYHLVDEMCMQIGPFLVGDKNNFSRLLSRLQKQNDRVSFTLKKVQFYCLDSKANFF